MTNTENLDLGLTPEEYDALADDLLNTPVYLEALSIAELRELLAR